MDPMRSDAKWLHYVCACNDGLKFERHLYYLFDIRRWGCQSSTYFIIIYCKGCQLAQFIFTVYTLQEGQESEAFRQQLIKTSVVTDRTHLVDTHYFFIPTCYSRLCRFASVQIVRLQTQLCRYRTPLWNSNSW